MTSPNLPVPGQLNNSSLSESQVEEPLTEIQRAFATRYLLDYNERSAAIFVGIAPSEGANMLRHPSVMSHVIALQSAREKLCIIGKDFVATQWLQVIPMLKGEVSVPLVTKNGSAVEEKKFFASELVRALIEVGNISGLSKPLDIGPKKEAVNISLNFAGMASQPTIIIDQGE